MRPLPESFSVISRFLAADNPRAELFAWLQERCDLNQTMGGDEMRFIATVAVLVLQVSLPVGSADQK